MGAHETQNSQLWTVAQSVVECRALRPFRSVCLYILPRYYTITRMKRKKIRRQIGRVRNSDTEIKKEVFYKKKGENSDFSWTNCCAFRARNTKIINSDQILDFFFSVHIWSVRQQCVYMYDHVESHVVFFYLLPLHKSSLDFTLCNPNV